MPAVPSDGTPEEVSRDTPVLGGGRRVRRTRRVLGAACLALLLALPAAARAGFYTTPFGRTWQSSFYAPAAVAPAMTTSYYGTAAGYGAAPVGTVAYRPLFPRLAQRRAMRQAWRRGTFGGGPAAVGSSYSAGYAPTGTIAYYGSGDPYSANYGSVTYGTVGYDTVGYGGFDSCGSGGGVVYESAGVPAAASYGYAPSSCAPSACAPPPCSPCQSSCAPCGGTVIGGGVIGSGGGCPNGNCGSYIVNTPVTPAENIEPLPETKDPIYDPPPARDDRSRDRDFDDPLGPPPARDERTRDLPRRDRTPDPIRDDDFDRLPQRDDPLRDEPLRGDPPDEDFPTDGFPDDGGIDFGMPDPPTDPAAPGRDFEPPRNGTDLDGSFDPLDGLPAAGGSSDDGLFRGDEDFPGVGNQPDGGFGDDPGASFRTPRGGTPDEFNMFGGEPSAVTPGDVRDTFRPLTLDELAVGDELPPPAADSDAADDPGTDALDTEVPDTDARDDGVTNDDATDDGALGPGSVGVRVSGTRPFRRTVLSPGVGRAKLVRADPSRLSAAGGEVRVAGN